MGLFDVERTPMKLDAHITRRSLVAATATLLLAGCGAGDPVGSDATGSAQDVPAASADGQVWTAALDPEAPFLNVAGEEGAAMPKECWVRREDGTVQVQVAGSSIPEPEVIGTSFSDGCLTVSLALPEEDTPATMDYVLHQFMITPAKDAEVTRVLLARGEEVLELPAGELVEFEVAE